MDMKVSLRYERDCDSEWKNMFWDIMGGGTSNLENGLSSAFKPDMWRKGLLSYIVVPQAQYV
jgi:hypothetical protein